MEKVLAVFNCLFYVIMAMVWTKENTNVELITLNFVIKIVISGLALANIVYALQLFGYVVKQ